MAMERINGQDNRNVAYYQSTAANEKTPGKNEDVDNNKQDTNTNTIYAGDLELGQNDLLAKKEQMQKTALKVLMDAVAGDQKIDDTMDAHSSKVAELEKEAGEASGEMDRIEHLKQELKETCGIADDSQEQKDLELLEKKKDISNGFSNSTLTKEEQERIKTMGPLTDYQQAALQYHDMELTWRKRLDNANNTIFGEHRTIDSIKLAKLKIHPIVDANKDSQKIMDTASKEYISGLVDEAKDNIDEKVDDDADTTEDIKEKEKKQQEEAAKSSEKKEEAAKNSGKQEEEKKTQKLKDNIVPVDQKQSKDIDWDKIQRDIKAVADRANMLTEDLKGLTVDEQL